MSSDTESECAICLDPIEPDTFYRFKCTHRLHKNCFKQYVQYKYDIEKNSLLCPICKQDIEVKPVTDFRFKIIYGVIFLSLLSVTTIVLKQQLID